MNGQFPLLVSKDFNSSRFFLSHPETEYLIESCLLEAFIIIFSIFLLGPLTTLVIVPATGETNFIFGFFLLKKIGDPNFTEAPSFKISFGAIPKKSSGLIAKFEGETVLSKIFSAPPFKLRFAPLRVRISFITSIKSNS